MNNKILVDDCDAELLTNFKWAVRDFQPGYPYACRSEQKDGKTVNILLHRVILGAAKGQFVDHINGNGLDCRRANIRICSHAENMRNRKTAKTNKLGVKGVYLDGKKFRVQIAINKVRHNLGTFFSLDEAKIAYNQAAMLLHQEFARTN